MDCSDAHGAGGWSSAPDRAGVANGGSCGAAVDSLMPPDDEPTRLALDRLIEDARNGLWSAPPRLPARWFYDDVGSRLFDEITRLPEYYPPRAETEILTEHSADVGGLTEATRLIELGSGTSTKTRLLLAALTTGGRRIRFVPIDVSGSTLEDAAQTIVRRHPTVQ